MATYDEQILNFFAEAVSEDIGLSQSMFDVWCVDGAMDVISKMPEELLEKFGNLTADKTTDGYTSNLPLYVLRENGTDGKYVTCRKIDGGLLFEWEQNLATKNDPAWYVKDGKVYVLPTPGASPDAFKVYEVTKPTIDASADSSISYFPNELEKLAAVIYPVIMGKMRQVEKMRRNSQDELEAITTSGYLASFENALPPSFVAPTPPTKTLSYTSAGNAVSATLSYSSVGSMIVPSISYTSAGSQPSSTISVSSSLPTYNGPTNVVIDTGAINNKLASDYEDPAMATAEINKARATIEETVTNVNRGINQFNAEVNKYLAELREQTDEVRAGIDAYVAKEKDNLNEMQEGVEKARAEISSYDAKGRDNLNSLQKEINQYRLDIDSYVAKERDNFNSFQEGVEQYRGDLAKHQSETNAEAQRFNSDLQKAQSYLSEASVRLQTMQNFDNKSVIVRSEINDLWQQYNQGIAAYISKYIPSKVED